MRGADSREAREAGEDEGEVVDAREVLLQADIREAPLEADDGEDILQIVAVGRYLPRLCKPLAKARLRNERNVEEVFYFHTSKYI